MHTDHELALVASPLAEGKRTKVRGFGFSDKVACEPSPCPSPLEREKYPSCMYMR